MDIHLQVPLSEKEYTDLKAIASERGQSIDEVARYALLKIRKEFCLCQFAELAYEYYREYKVGKFYEGRLTKSRKHIPGYKELMGRLPAKARRGRGLDKRDLLDILKWGADQRTRKKFEDNKCSFVREQTRKAYCCSDSRQAFLEITKLTGWGLTYGSKTLMFMNPEKYAALDRKNMAPKLQKIIGSFGDGSDSQTQSYLKFLKVCREIQSKLTADLMTSKERVATFTNDSKGRPRLADIQQAIFQCTQEDHCIVPCSHI